MQVPVAAASRVGHLPRRTFGVARRRLRDAVERARSTAEDRRHPPLVTYAEMLDGDTLCLCVRDLDPTTTLALRRPEGGSSTDLGPLRGQQRATGCLGGYVDLGRVTSELDPGTEVTFELAAPRRPGDQTTTTMRWAGDSPRSPVVPPASADGRWRWRIRRGPSVVLSAVPIPPGAVVTAVAVGDGGFLLRFAGAGPEPARIRLTRDGELLAELPAVAAGDTHEAWVGEGDCGIVPGQSARFTVVVGDRELPLRRRHLDLQSPGSAVTLPILAADDPTPRAPVLRLQYRPDGQLTLRRQGQRTATPGAR